MDAPPSRPPARPPAVEEQAEQRVDPTVWLARLRSSHPDWAFVYDPFALRWIAVRGRHEALDARTAFELADALTEIGRDHTMPFPDI
ncbi:MAG: hypothetical protein QOE54_5129 [Streptosporangiaceae bacterium]|jgi:hypothetical protein|nr:hypothetical protein [Streptosporangiaceae bacterium]MDX6432763.1 hypothetical protein [Streptosporangiaceae bacterium]